MSIIQALNTSLSGLRATQSELSLIASNVANAQTPGYVRKSLELATSTAGQFANGVRVLAVTRELDEYIQRQLRVESSGGAYASQRADFYRRLQSIYGEPGSDSALETVFNKFVGAIQALVTSPDSTAARGIALSTAQVLARSLNNTTRDIQAMRGDAESAIADAVTTANHALGKIAEINAQLAGRPSRDAADAALMDERDRYIDRLTELLDVRVVVNSQNQVSLFTNSGVQLLGSAPNHLAFNPQGTVSAATLWSDDPAQSGLGSILLVSPTGSTVDLIANGAIRSGRIAALIEMRDSVLVEAQNQIDNLAAMMASALSDETVAGAAAVVGAQTGYDIDVAGLQDGNSISLTYTDVQTGVQSRVTFVRVDDPNAAPLTDAFTADPADRVHGVDFSGGMASVVGQLNAFFNGQVQFSNPAGTTLRVLDDGAGNLADVDALSLTRTVGTLAGGGGALPFFTDGATLYTGAATATGSQRIGLAGRIAVNPDLLSDPAGLVLYGPDSSAGDPTRPDFIFQRLTETVFSFAPEVGFGSSAAPYSGSLPAFLRQVLSAQGEAAANAKSLSEGQDVVVNALRERFEESSGVNVDQEMAHLINLQTAYSANARVMSAIREMMDALLGI